MKLLMVFNTYEEVLKLHEQGAIPDNTSIVSLDEGAGRVKLIEGSKFDIVKIMDVGNTDNLLRYGDLLRKFISDMKTYDIIDESTIFC